MRKLWGWLSIITFLAMSGLLGQLAESNLHWAAVEVISVMMAGCWIACTLMWAKYKGEDEQAEKDSN